MARVLTPQAEDFPRWYHDVVAKAQLAENGPVRAVRKDLEAFSGYLKKAVEGIEGADHLSSGALARLAEIRIGNEAERANLDARGKYVTPGPATVPEDD